MLIISDNYINYYCTLKQKCSLRKNVFIINYIYDLNLIVHYEIIQGTESVLSDLRDNGLDIKSTGGETADVGDLVRTIIVDSTVISRMPRDMVIDNANIAPGQVIVGLSSSGQSTYEKQFNGGMGSNGLTSARHDIFHKLLSQKYP